MNKAYSTHLPNFLDETGNVPERLPAHVRRLAKTMCTFVSYATNFDGEDDEPLPKCFSTVNGKRCNGRVFALPSIEDFSVIVWQCELCRTHGTITGWRSTLWDLSDRDSELH